MSCQPTPKTSRQVKTQPNKEQELYEHIEMQQEPSHYMTINRPNRVEVEDKSQPEPAGQISTKIKSQGKCVVIALIAVFLVCALIVSLVAVIMYSPLVSSGDNTEVKDLMLRIQQLEAMQGTNHSFKSIQESLVSIEAQVQRQSDYDGTVSSQFLNVHNSVQTLSSIQNNLRQDLDRLRTINFYEDCIQDTMTCQLSTSSITTYRSCNTGFVNINPGDTQYFTSSILCDFSYTNYFTSATYYKSGNIIRCECAVTYPSTAGHTTFSVSNGICTLTVTKCPYTRNLLN